MGADWRQRGYADALGITTDRILAVTVGAIDDATVLYSSPGTEPDDDVRIAYLRRKPAAFIVKHDKSTGWRVRDYLR